MIGRICVWSLALAPAVRMAKGMPLRSTMTVCFEPGLLQVYGTWPRGLPASKRSHNDRIHHHGFIGGAAGLDWSVLLTRVEVVNELLEETTLHWHGMELPGAADGGPHAPVAPGGTVWPSWTVAQPAATLWYHPHPHGTTTRQVLRGLAGVFLVDDDAPPPDCPPSTGWTTSRCCSPTPGSPPTGGSTRRPGRRSGRWATRSWSTGWPAAASR